jgi:hypothetical protein
MKLPFFFVCVSRFQLAKVKQLFVHLRIKTAETTALSQDHSDEAAVNKLTYLCRRATKHALVEESIPSTAPVEQSPVS